MEGEINAAVAIIESEARSEIQKADTLEGKFKAAFNVSKDHWMFLDNNLQQRAGIGAVMINIEQDSTDMARIKKEMKLLNALSAAVSGVPINFGEMIDDDDLEAIGIAKLWKES